MRKRETDKMIADRMGISEEYISAEYRGKGKRGENYTVFQYDPLEMRWYYLLRGCFQNPQELIDFFPCMRR